MRGYTEEVTKFNGRIIYGCDNNGVSHSPKWEFRNGRGGYVQHGYVAVQVNESGTIVGAKLLKTQLDAMKYNNSTVPSQGIMA